jgi:hypothetical protein
MANCELLLDMQRKFASWCLCLWLELCRQFLSTAPSPCLFDNKTFTHSLQTGFDAEVEMLKEYLQVPDRTSHRLLTTDVPEASPFKEACELTRYYGDGCIVKVAFRW